MDHTKQERKQNIRKVPFQLKPNISPFLNNSTNDRHAACKKIKKREENKETKAQIGYQTIMPKMLFYYMLIVKERGWETEKSNFIISSKYICVYHTIITS